MKDEIEQKKMQGMGAPNSGTQMTNSGHWQYDCRAGYIVAHRTHSSVAIVTRKSVSGMADPAYALMRSVVGMPHPAHAPFEVKLLGMNGNEIIFLTFEELQWYTVGALISVQHGE